MCDLCEKKKQKLNLGFLVSAIFFLAFSNALFGYSELTDLCIDFLNYLFACWNFFYLFGKC